MENYEDDPLTLFEDALSNALTRDKYTKRLVQRCNYLNLDGKTLQEKAQTFTFQAKRNPSWNGLVS